MVTLLINAWRAVAAHFAEWHRRQQAYAELAGLDDRSLADIGITRSEIPYVLSQPYEPSVPSGRKGTNGSLKHAA